MIDKSSISRFLKSIRFQLLLLVIVSMLPALAIVIYTGIDRRTSDIENEKWRIISAVQDLSQEHEHALASTRQLVKTLAMLPEVQKRQVEACNLLFAGLLKENSLYANIFAADAAGNVFAGARPFTSFNIRDRKFYRDVMRTGEFSVGEYRLGRRSGRHVLPCAYPVRDDQGRVTALVIAGIDLSRYGELLDIKRMSPGAVLSMSDHRGIRLYRNPDPLNLIGQADSPEMIRIMAGPADNGLFVAIGTDGVKRLYAYRRFHLRPGDPAYLYLRVGVPEIYTTKQANSQLLVNVILLFIAFLAAMLSAWSLGKTIIARRLERLAAAAEKIGGGNLATRSELPYRDDELGRLSHSFDEMASELEAAQGSRLQTEEVLRKSEEKYRLVVENVDQTILIVQDGIIRFVNQGGAALTGYDIATLTGSNISEYIHPEDRQLVVENHRKRLQGENFPHKYPFRILTRAGAVRWVEIHAVSIS